MYIARSEHPAMLADVYKRVVVLYMYMDIAFLIAIWRER